MSLDFYLYKKGAKAEFTLEELQKRLQVEFVVEKIHADERRKISSYALKLKKGKEDLPFEQMSFDQQEDGRYWIHTYDYETRSYLFFLFMVAQIARLLNLVIEDPQWGEKDILPDNFVTKKRAELGNIPADVLEKLPEMLEEANESIKKSSKK